MTCEIPGKLASGEYRDKIHVLCPSVTIDAKLPDNIVAKVHLHDLDDLTYAQRAIWERMLNDPRITKRM